MERRNQGKSGSRDGKPSDNRRTGRSSEKSGRPVRSKDSKPASEKRSFKSKEGSAESSFRERSPKPEFKKPGFKRDSNSSDKPSRSRSADPRGEKKSFGSDKPFKARSFRPRTDEANVSDSDSPRSFEKKDNTFGKKVFRPGGDKPFRTGRPSFKDKPKRSTAKRAEDGSIRLNKHVASTGLCSRREADEMIKAGVISVNGEAVTELGTKIMPGDEVRYNGERLKREKMLYLLLNKPKDYVTTAKDPFAKRTVMDLVKDACLERIYPVGRLDRNTTGVLLFTNDGDLTRKLTHPSYNKKKIYHAFLDKNFSHDDLRKVAEGFELEDGFVKADEVHYADPVDKKQVGVEIHSGKNRVVRRIFEHLGYKVTKLDRVFFAGLTKKGLQRGEWRFLTTQEIASVKMGSHE